MSTRSISEREQVDTSDTDAETTAADTHAVNTPVVLVIKHLTPGITNTSTEV